MIRIQRNGQKNCQTVFVGIEPGLPTETRLLWFALNCGNADYAALLEAHLRKELQRTIKQAHRLAYERGWKDAKSKKAKKATWFPFYFTDSAPAIAR
jgi:hypothetical protein